MSFRGSPRCPHSSAGGDCGAFDYREKLEFTLPSFFGGAALERPHSAAVGLQIGKVDVDVTKRDEVAHVPVRYCRKTADLLDKPRPLGRTHTIRRTECRLEEAVPSDARIEPAVH